MCVSCDMVSSITGESFFRICAVRARIYFNLHKRVYSIMAWEGAKKGRVVGHSFFVDLRNVSFIVQPAGQRRVRETEQKNVHAFVEGYLVEAGNLNSLDADDWHRVVYDPYRWDTFMAEADGGELVTILEADGVYGEVSSGHPKMYAWGLTTDTR